MKEIVEEKIKNRDFSFMELLKIEDLAKEMASETYEELSTNELLKFAWNIKITAPKAETIGDLFKRASIELLRREFTSALKEFMENATVSVGEVKVPEPEVKVELEEPVVELEEPTVKIPKEPKEIGNDGIGLPKGVKRFE